MIEAVGGVIFATNEPSRTIFGAPDFISTRKEASLPCVA